MFNPLGPFYSFQFAFLLVFATAYYKMAELEGSSGIAWAGMSVGVYMFTWRWLGWSHAGNFFGQAVLFGGITLWRVWKDRDRGDQK